MIWQISFLIAALLFQFMVLLKKEFNFTGELKMKIKYVIIGLAAVIVIVVLAAVLINTGINKKKRTICGRNNCCSGR